MKEAKELNEFIISEIKFLEKYPAFKKFYKNNCKEFIDMFMDALLSKHLIEQNFPIRWFFKNINEAMFLDSKKKNIFELLNKISLNKRKKVKKVLVFIRTNNDKLDKDFFGWLSGDVREDFAFTNEKDIYYTIIYHKDKHNQPKNKNDFRETLLIGW